MKLVKINELCDISHLKINKSWGKKIKHEKINCVKITESCKMNESCEKNLLKMIESYVSVNFTCGSHEYLYKWWIMWLSCKGMVGSGYCYAWYLTWFWSVVPSNEQQCEPIYVVGMCWWVFYWYICYKMLSIHENSSACLCNVRLPLLCPQQCCLRLSVTACSQLQAMWPLWFNSGTL